MMLIILDVMLPKKDGWRCAATCAEQRVNTPILMLTARDAVEDRVAGLDSGADDYLVKPFAINELRARLRALLRRDVRTTRPASCSSPTWCSTRPGTRVERAGSPIELTAQGVLPCWNTSCATPTA